MKISGFSTGTWENRLRQLLKKANLRKLAKMSRSHLRAFVQRLSMSIFKDNMPNN